MNKPDKWWKYLIPKYGNWGGAGWSGGTWVNDPSKTNWNIKSIDEMDKVFKEHDYYYQHCKKYTYFADINLIVKLKDLKINSLYKNIYKNCAIIAFILKVLIFSNSKK